MQISAQLLAAITWDHLLIIIDCSSISNRHQTLQYMTNHNAFGSSSERVNSHLSKIVRPQMAPFDRMRVQVLVVLRSISHKPLWSVESCWLPLFVPFIVIFKPLCTKTSFLPTLRCTKNSRYSAFWYTWSLRILGRRQELCNAAGTLQRYKGGCVKKVQSKDQVKSYKQCISELKESAAVTLKLIAITCFPRHSLENGRICAGVKSTDQPPEMHYYKVRRSRLLFLWRQVARLALWKWDQQTLWAPTCFNLWHKEGAHDISCFWPHSGATSAKVKHPLDILNGSFRQTNIAARIRAS